MPRQSSARSRRPTTASHWRTRPTSTSRADRPSTSAPSPLPGERPALPCGAFSRPPILRAMRIVDAFAAGKPAVISFEFFPPRSPEAEARLFDAVEQLAPLHPTFVSVAYGAGGATRRLTRDIVVRIKRDIGVEAMAHLTCLGHTVAELTEILDG